MKNNLLFVLTISILSFLVSCKNDDSSSTPTPDPTFDVSGITIDDSEYTAGGTIVPLFSTDGTTFSSELPVSLETDATIFIKLNNGTEDLTSEDFEFEWTVGSETFTDDVLEITIAEQDIEGSVTVSDIMTLITSHRNSGEFFSVSTEDGTLASLFTAKIDGTEDLTDTRGFVYHYNQQKFYVSQSSYAADEETLKGLLYTIDPVTKNATLINDNDGSDNEGTADEWDAINNWYVMEDDSLLAIGDFNGDASDGLVKFGVDGGRAVPVEADICCGMGMLYNSGDDEITVASSYDAEDGEVHIVQVDFTGEITSSTIITTFTGFPSDPSEEWLNVKALAKSKEGIIYAILFTYGSRDSHLVTIDLTTETVRYISTLGEGNADQYNTLVIVPNYTL